MGDGDLSPTGYEIDTDARPKPDVYDRPGGMTEHAVPGTEVKIAVPEPGRLAAWIRLRSDREAMVLAETPEEARDRWTGFIQADSAPYTIFHEYATGRPIYYFRPAITDLAYIQITYQSTAPRVTGRSFWTGNCPCEQCAIDRE